MKWQLEEELGERWRQFQQPLHNACRRGGEQRQFCDGSHHAVFVYEDRGYDGYDGDDDDAGVTSSSHVCTSHTHDAYSDKTQRYGECFRSADCTCSNTTSPPSRKIVVVLQFTNQLPKLNLYT